MQPSYRIGFAIEHTLGHVTFANTLRRLVDADPSIHASWHLVQPETMAWPATVRPFSRNGTLQASITARRLVGLAPQLDVLMMHTQTLMLLFARLLRRVPGVLSTDATPKNIDDVGQGYWHFPGNPVAEEVKRRLTGASIRRASVAMPWNNWAMRSLTGDYGMPAQRCRVLHPGLDVTQWSVAAHEGDGPVRFLFVGGQFQRKGGGRLLEALARLAAEGVDYECDVVTKEDVPRLPGVRCHTGLGPGDERLGRFYRDAHVFVLPTKGDAMPWAVLEAMAAGLPVVSTRLGAIPELVDGRTGLLVEPDDVDSLVRALRELALDPGRRRRMGLAGRERVVEDYNEAVNGPRVIELLKATADDGRRRRAGTASGPGPH